MNAPIRVALEDRPGQSGRPRFGVVDFNPVQYRTPLYQLITRRARVELDVLFLTDDGHSAYIDPGFGVPVSWDIDLLSGYEYQFLTMFRRAFLGPESHGTPCPMGFRS